MCSYKKPFKSTERGRDRQTDKTDGQTETLRETESVCEREGGGGRERETDRDRERPTDTDGECVCV